MARGESKSGGERRRRRRGGASRRGRAERARKNAEAASRVLGGVRRLRSLGILGGREFDLWLVALRARETTPTRAAAALGITSALLNPRISRWMTQPQCRSLVERHARGRYRLTSAGAVQADEVVGELRRAFADLGRS